MTKSKLEEFNRSHKQIFGESTMVAVTFSYSFFGNLSNRLGDGIWSEYQTSGRCSSQSGRGTFLLSGRVGYLESWFPFWK